MVPIMEHIAPVPSPITGLNITHCEGDSNVSCQTWLSDGWSFAADGTESGRPLIITILQVHSSLTWIFLQ